MSYTHILVPTDFSVLANQAVAHACEDAEHHEASLTLLHVLHHPDTAVYYVSGAPQQLGDFADESGSTLPGRETPGPESIRRDYLDEALSQLRDLLPASFTGTCEVQAESGHPAEVIVRMARERAVDLIVMGTHGRTGLPHVLMGSVAEKVVRLAPCSVLIVRGE